MKGYWINHVIDIEDPERFGVDSISKAMEIYYSPEYGAALAAGGMEGDETHVVQRTICAIEVSQ